MTTIGETSRPIATAAAVRLENICRYSFATTTIRDGDPAPGTPGQAAQHRLAACQRQHPHVLAAGDQHVERYEDRGPPAEHEVREHRAPRATPRPGPTCNAEHNHQVTSQLASRADPEPISWQARGWLPPVPPLIQQSSFSTSRRPPSFRTVPATPTRQSGAEILGRHS